MKRTANRKKYAGQKKVDKGLLSLIAAFLLFGLIIIYDVTVVLSQGLYGNAYGFAVLQLAWILVGLAGFFVFLKLDLEVIKKLSVVLFGITLFFLIVLAFFGVLPCDVDFIFAPCVNGANRWIYFNPPPLPSLPILGVLGFQASELAKFSLILFLSASLEKAIKEKRNAFVVFAGITGLTAVLILLQPNLSTAALVFAIGTVIYFASGASLKPILISFPIIGVIGLTAMLTFSHTRERLMTFFAFGGGSTDLSTGYHIKQILIALGSGGFFGLGFGQSRQKFQYLPEVFSDSIFAVIGEELGFVGTTFLVLLFVALIYKGYIIAKNTDGLFEKMAAVGVTTWIALQFFVNVGAMTKIIPLTGIPLPLISYGGSSLVFMLMGLGVLANVSKTRQ